MLGLAPLERVVEVGGGLAPLALERLVRLAFLAPHLAPKRLKLVALRAHLVVELPALGLGLLAHLGELLLVVNLALGRAVALLLHRVLKLRCLDLELRDLDVAVAHERLQMVERRVVALELGIALLEQLQVVREVFLELGQPLLALGQLALLFSEQAVERLDPVLIDVV